MSPFLGERDIPHPTSVKVNRLFPFLFIGNLVSQCPQGQNLLWYMCNLSNVNEIVKQRRWFGSGFVTGERKSFCPLIYREISVWLKYAHLFAVLFSQGLFPGGLTVLVETTSLCRRALEPKRADSIWLIFVRGIFSIRTSFQWLLQSSFYLYLEIKYLEIKIWILAYQNMHVWWPKFCIFIRCQALLLSSAPLLYLTETWMFLCPLVL